MSETLIAIEPLSWLGILSAMLSGGIIGTERQILGKPAGIRTSMLICVGTYVYVMVSNSVATDITDHSRVIGQVITGIGFLGAGVMLSRDGLVYGVTSAATIWVLAAIGVTIASGFNLTGVKLALLTVVILIGIDMLENTFKAFQKGVHAKLIFRKKE
jgi:putative Mg2+ transporter-C (MgtC) family protein